MPWVKKKSRVPSYDSCFLFFRINGILKVQFSVRIQNGRYQDKFPPRTQKTKIEYPSKNLSVRVRPGYCCLVIAAISHSGLGLGLTTPNNQQYWPGGHQHLILFYSIESLIRVH